MTSQMGPLSLIFVPFCIGSILYYLYGIFAGLRFVEAIDHPSASDFQPPVSVIKPLCGADRNLYQNLVSFCQQDYPLYQIVFGVKDPADPSIAIVQKLIADFPEIDIKLVVNDAVMGSNLKVNNLANAAAIAKHPFWVLADSDVLVTPTYLTRIMQPFRDSTVGAVTCLYRPLAQGRIAHLETLGIATDYLAGVIVAHQLGEIQFTLGPTAVVRRSAFTAAGGFDAIANYLADDYQIGWIISQTNHKVVLSDYVIDHLIETKSWNDLIQRQVRWNLCTKVSRPWGYLGLVFTHGTVTSLGFLLSTAGSTLGWAVLALVWSLRLMMAWTIGDRVLKAPITKQLLWLVPVRDLLSFLIWCYSPLVRKLEWRGQFYRLMPGGKLIPIQTLTKSRQVLATPFSQSK